MKKLLIIVSVLFVAIIMMITTPDKQTHKEAMMSAIRDFVDDEADSLGLGDNVLTDILTLYIDDLCVDETARGSHIGTQLYEHVLSFAREKGCYNVTLNVWAGNDSALKFYQHQGLNIQKYGMEVIL